MDVFRWHLGDDGKREEPDPSLSPDTALALVVVDRLRRERRLCSASIAVDVQDCVVILAGDVSSFACRVLAGDVAWQTPRVRDVCNQLTVRGGDASPLVDS